MISSALSKSASAIRGTIYKRSSNGNYVILLGWSGLSNIEDLYNSPSIDWKQWFINETYNNHNESKIVSDVRDWNAVFILVSNGSFYPAFHMGSTA